MKDGRGFEEGGKGESVYIHESKERLTGKGNGDIIESFVESEL